MGLSGLVGAGAQAGLADLLQQQLVEQQMAQRQQALEAEERNRREALALRQRELESLDQSREFQQAVTLEGIRERQAAAKAAEDQAAYDKTADANMSELVNDPVQMEAFGMASGRLKPIDILNLRERRAATANAETPEQKSKRELGEYEAKKKLDLKYRPPDSAVSKPQYQRVIVDGKETFMTPEEVRARGGVTPEARRKPVTGAERNNLGFYQRAAQAEEIAAPLETAIANMSLREQAWLQAMPNFAQSKENQMYRQAQRAFTEARLRKESGAAIPEGEYENDARTYFAQPGDGPDVIKQKQAARKQVLEGMAVSTGQAWEEYHGEPYQRQGTSPGAGTVKWERGPDGVLRKVGG